MIQNLYISVPASKQSTTLTLFQIWDSWNLQHQRFLVIENHLKKIGKDHTKFLEKQSFTQGVDRRFILKVTINKFTSIQNKLFMILNFNIN